MKSPLTTVAVLVVVASVTPELHAAGERGVVEPSVEEQFAVWTLNEARHDPPAYGRRIGVDLSSVAPQPPLAVNPRLTGSARRHATEMLDADYFGHVSAVTGEGPDQMAVDGGYDLFGAGLDVPRTAANTIESIARGIVLIPTFDSALALLVEDKGVPGAGHRVHLLATQPPYEAHREIGCGRAARRSTYLYAIHTANVSEADRFLTGVVFDDADGDARFGKGEGIGGVVVDAGGGYATTSMTAGGWSIRVPQGTYKVTCSGRPFAGTATATVTVGASNVEVDFRSGFARGEVDFGGAAGRAPADVAAEAAGPGASAAK